MQMPFCRQFHGGGIRLLMSQTRLNIRRLFSGGVIANYHCSARCKHCLYASSPQWPKHYMDPSTADRVFQALRRLGCRAVHIGGGEPLLDVDRLKPVLDMAVQHEVEIDYIETNCSWYRSEDQAVDVLRQLQRHGVSTLLISISPFHNEFVAMEKVMGMILACRRAGTGMFPWQEQFYAELAELDAARPHSLDELEQRFGPGYCRRLKDRFGLTMRGRALLYYEPILDKRPYRLFLEQSQGCRELEQVMHFHVDLGARYIPGSCSGLACAVSDLGQPLHPEDYPLLTALYSRGVAGLHDFAAPRGFEPQPQYVSKCHLCMDIRRFLALESGEPWAELEPVEYYRQVQPRQTCPVG